MTIEERAEKITEEVLGDFATSFLGYIDEMTEIFCKNVAVRMAKEQKAIDIDKACEVYCNMCFHFYEGSCTLEIDKDKCSRLTRIRKAMED